ncbi:MAG TPA: 3-methyl-2-oxobutanoate dehydrogenase subunit VorB [Candidatus Scatomorpha stercorigallinarum]|uniref:3-methyl-2-oxobutanoate dehydrogenase subunit VorB n=1 Tax=Candidatus Scatomorpha pullistercoris TaxID=2840929 RepID=A0A9D1G554_9FIRM|nr:3-methyl-2-oxobutanoate dehydrogenase subunit VorB [Candidatus Scatomorpha pullistercoris]HIV20755.1 3-methyl-2-oxobutanoate dehydrogenase subunit VorB [Candidatus Scatomorpha stercorigallinarum]
MALTLMKGSEAIAEAAIRAGCRYFFGYPITPQTEIPEYMSARMPEIGGCFLQAESEVGAINMVYGAAGTGARVLTSSSSPGVSLKQEGISYIAASELPCVIMNVMRGGPGLGSIQAGQGDYFQATKGGGHGDYHLVVFAPASVQEAIDLMAVAFDTADKYRNPVMVVADGMICQMMEPVVLPEMQDYKVDYSVKTWAANGHGMSKPQRAIINSLYINTDELDVLNERLQATYRVIEANEVRYEAYNLEGAEIVCTAFGTVARITKSAIDDLKEEGFNVGLIRPITLWPFPYKELHDAATAPGVKAVLDVELNAGQMLEDVKLAMNGDQKVDFFGHYGSHMPTPEEIKEKLLSMREVL